MGVKLRVKNLKDGGKSYYLDIYHNGKRWYEFLNTHTTKATNNPLIKQSNLEAKRYAETKAAQRKLDLATQGSDFVPNHFKEMYFSDFAENFINKYRYKDVRIVSCAIDKFKESLTNPMLTISQITPDIMEKYKHYLIYDAGLSGETAHNYFTRFKKVLKSAKIKGFIKSMPTEDITFKNPNKDDTLKKQILEIEELRTLVNTHCGNEEVKRAFLFCCYTGLGIAEIKQLKWSNIRNGRLVTNRMKTGSSINNQLTGFALKLIGEPKGRDENVFDIPISDNAINKNLTNWLKRAKIDKKITFYCARHSFACLLLMNGANLKSVADAMGHSSTKTTLKYLNYVERLKDEAINNLPDIRI